MLMNPKLIVIVVLRTTQAYTDSITDSSDSPIKPLVYTPETLQSKDSHRLDSNGVCDVLSLNQKILVLHTWYHIPEGFVH